MKWRVPGKEIDQRKLGDRLWKKFCKACGLNREDAMDRSRWRKQIRIFDDHDGCEWVNVSSGTGSPGLSRTKSRAKKRLCVGGGSAHVRDWQTAEALWRPPRPQVADRGMPSRVQKRVAPDRECAMDKQCQGEGKL